MAAPSLVPTLEDLRRSLDHAETELVCADFIDDMKRRQEQLSYWRDRKKDLAAQIARIEETM